MSTETAAPAPQVDAATLAAENAAITAVADNPNPTGAPVAAPAAPAPTVETPVSEPPAERGFETAAEKRTRIAAEFKARRDQDNAGIAPDQIVTTTFGEIVPPFVAQATAKATAAATAAAEEQAEADRVAAEAEAAKAAASAEPKPYTLKVRGNDVPVASRAELLKLAEVDDEDADAYTDASLIRLAQKQMAASAILDEAKQASKSARQTARASDTTPSEPAVETLEDPNAETSRTTPADPVRKAYEAIQFGEPEEGAEALNDLVRGRVSEALQEDRLLREGNRITKEIGDVSDAFSVAHPDIANDPIKAPLFLNSFMAPVIEKALVETGMVTAENAKAHCQNYAKAIQAYTVARASGKVSLPTPEAVLEGALAGYRTTFPSSNPTPAAPAAPVHDRAAEKRALPQHPTRGSSTPPIAVTTPALTPQEKALLVVQQMKAKRGQSTRA